MLWTWYRPFVKDLLEENIIKRFCLCSGTSSSQLRDLGTAFEACRRKDILVSSINLFRNFLGFSRSFCSFHIISVPFASFQHVLHHFGTFCTISETFASFLNFWRHFCTFSFICTFASFLHHFMPFFWTFHAKFCSLFASTSPNGLFPVPF